MNQHFHFKNISELNRAIHQPAPKHPLVSVIDFNKVENTIPQGAKISTDFYSIMFKNYCSNKIKYGRQYYDFQEGNLICISPKQVITLLEEETEEDANENKMGWGLFFHPDLIRGTSLNAKMSEYSFFSYEVSESLHLSEKEQQILLDCIQKIEIELHENIDSYSQNLIVTNIELLLNYCLRYYGRQFITRKNTNSSTVSAIEKLLKAYFESDKLKESGLPTVKYLADHVHLSPSYLSDLLKKETGMNAQDHIHYYLIEEAKNILLHTDNTIGEVAFSLGFEYPQYFSKLFKQKTGQTPIEYRNLN